MSRRLCITALVLALLLPAAPLFADDDRWQMPDLGAWIMSLLQLDPSPVLGEKAGGDPGQQDPPPSNEDPGENPTENGGMFGEPNG